MSYSFQIRAADKAAAKAAIAEKFEGVIASQACHARDKDQALAAAGAFIDMLPDDADHDVQVNMSGYLSGTWEGSDVTRITMASVSVSAGLATRNVAA